MMRAALPLLCVLVACGGAEEAVPGKDNVTASAPSRPAQPQGDSFAAAGDSREQADGAAEVARTYFAHVAARRYEEAWRLRWRSGEAGGLDAFAANFDRYESYRAQIGPPRPPQEANGTIFVDLPVQIQGRLRNGEGFVSAGMITLRRDAGEPDGAWRIH